jgi:hypothetical protein
MYMLSSDPPTVASIGSVIVQVSDPHTKQREDIQLEFYNDGKIIASRKVGVKTIPADWTPIKTLCYYAPTLDIDLGGEP